MIAYYNAGSAALVLILIFAGIGTFVWCRFRRPRAVVLGGNEEESIPLNASRRMEDEVDDETAAEEARSQFWQSKGKGKGRAVEPEVHEPPIFDVGDSDEEDDRVHTRKE